MQEKHKTTLAWIILLVSLFGIVITSYLSYLHFKPPAPDEHVFGCFTGSGCSAVNASEYSSFLGIPVAMLGLIGYVLIFVFSILFLMKRKADYATSAEKYIVFIFLIGLIGTLFQAYLTYISATVIHAYCSHCLLSEVCITLIMMLSLFLCFPQLKAFWEKYTE